MKSGAVAHGHRRAGAEGVGSRGPQNAITDGGVSGVSIGTGERQCAAAEFGQRAGSGVGNNAGHGRRIAAINVDGGIGAGQSNAAGGAHREVAVEAESAVADRDVGGVGAARRGAQIVVGRHGQHTAVDHRVGVGIGAGKDQDAVAGLGQSATADDTRVGQGRSQAGHRHVDRASGCTDRDVVVE